MQKILRLNEVKINMNYYPREEYSYNIALKYSEAMEMGAKFPPIIVAHIKGKYWLVDGMHRLKAHQLRKEPHISVEIAKDIGNFKKLYVKAVEANIQHGKQLTEHDKNIIIDRLRELKVNDQDICRLIHVPITRLSRINFGAFKKSTSWPNNRPRRKGYSNKVIDYSAPEEADMAEPDEETTYVTDTSKRFIIYPMDEELSKFNYYLIRSDHYLAELQKIINLKFEIEQVTHDKYQKIYNWEREKEAEKREKVANAYMKKHREELELNQESGICTYCGNECEPGKDLCEDCGGNLEDYQVRKNVA